MSISVFPQILKAKIGDRIAFTCVASGHPVPSVSWSLFKSQVSERVKVHKGVLTIKDVKEHDGGTYHCTARNPYGAASAKVKVVVSKRK